MAKKIKPLNTVRCCGDCGGEGCCDRQELNVIPLEALLERPEEDFPCKGSVCGACEECEP